MNQPAIATRARRRWRSFSLRSLFVAITLMAIGLAWVGYERRQSQRELAIAEQLEAAGTIVRLTWPFDHDDQEDESWWRLALGDLLGPRIQGVEGHRDQFTDLAPLVQLKNLQDLYLNHTQVRDLSPLAGLNNLDVLSLNDTQVRDLSPLAGLNNLRFLCLDHPSQ